MDSFIYYASLGLGHAEQKRSMELFCNEVIPAFAKVKDPFSERTTRMPAEIRRTILNIQTTHIEGGKGVPEPTKLIAAMVIIKNPWHGRGWVEDLSPEVRDIGPEIGKLLTDMILDVTGDKLEGYGNPACRRHGRRDRACPGADPFLVVRQPVPRCGKGETYLAFANTRGAAGTSLMIPLMDKDDGGRRSHYQTIHLSVQDAPAEDEIIVALGASIGGHPLHRIGDRYQDLKERWVATSITRRVSEA